MNKKQMLKNAENQMKKYKGINGEQKTLDNNFMNLLKQPAVSHLIERQIGNYEIKIEIVPALKELIVVSARNWLMMGYKQLKVVFDFPRPLYKLLRNRKQLLMSDSPQEMFLQYDAYKEAKGKVLVGGLGLGMYATMIANKEEVNEVVVVEIDKDIIKLCKPTNKKIVVINENIYKFAKYNKEKFDYIYIDIHYSTGVMIYKSTVIPLKKIFGNKTPISFWGEEEMKAQYNPNWN